MHSAQTLQRFSARTRRGQTRICAPSSMPYLKVMRPRPSHTKSPLKSSPKFLLTRIFTTIATTGLSLWTQGVPQPPITTRIMMKQGTAGGAAGGKPVELTIRIKVDGRFTGEGRSEANLGPPQTHFVRARTGKKSNRIILFRALYPSKSGIPFSCPVPVKVRNIAQAHRETCRPCSHLHFFVLWGGIVCLR